MVEHMCYLQAEIISFKIKGESSTAAGIRRIESDYNNFGLNLISLS